MLTLVNPYQVVIDSGPVQMSVTAERRGEPIARELRKLEELVNNWLDDLRRYLPFAKKAWPELPDDIEYPKILSKMLSAVSLAGELNLTPMAAVAGSISELVCEHLAKRGASKVLVNNGGDIAMHLGSGEKTRVGIVPRLGVKPSHYLDVEGKKIGGIATSGRGGRSFTLGIADAAVAIAATSSIADACATVLGNAVNVDSPFIERKVARDLDPATDIPELLVTCAVPSLPQSLKQEALEHGLMKARELVERKIIYGAALFLQGEMRQFPSDLIHPI
ncbi:UPF0280 family protein [Paradesulfitobacterium aromaticivorans]